MRAQAAATEGKLHKALDVQEFGLAKQGAVVGPGGAHEQNRFEAWVRAKRPAEARGYFLARLEERCFHDCFETF